MDEKKDSMKQISSMFKTILGQITRYKGTVKEDISLLNEFIRLNTEIFLVLPKLSQSRRRLVRHRAKLLRTIFNDKWKKLNLEKK